MTQPRRLSLIRRLSQLGTVLDTWLCGVKMGNDSFGNVYYRARRTPQGRRERRWVLYANEPEASMVPPDWHGWLHHNADAPLPEDSPYRRPWQKPHQPNMTGTEAAYFPAGHLYAGGKRPPATGDYEAWKPEE